jgi:tetratricopeptide (TPR) repeat protein
MPEWATADELDLEVRRDLRGLSKDGAEFVAAHLVAATALADDDPETAWHHARAARARGGRIGVVRETVGLVAYRAGEWAEAIGELRAARRMGGGPGHLAVMADCERALGHPERAIELSRSAEAEQLDPEASAELTIVVAGARADLGQIDTALAHLERVGLDRAEQHPRLAYAYADLLLKAGRKDEALSWFIRSANADEDEETDALERVEELSAELPTEGGEVLVLSNGASDSSDLSESAESLPAESLPGESPSGESLPGVVAPWQEAVAASDTASGRRAANMTGGDRRGGPEPKGANVNDLDESSGPTDGQIVTDQDDNDATDGNVLDAIERRGVLGGPEDVVDPAEEAAVELELSATSETDTESGRDHRGDKSDESTTSEPPEVPDLLFSDNPQSGDR